MLKIKRELHHFKILLRSVPSGIVAFFVASVLAMNLLANKSIDFRLDWLALDCGMLISWVAFLAMDIITKRFGPKAATQLSAFAIAVNMLFCLIFFVASKIPGTWSQSAANNDISEALDKTFGGSWYVVLGSALAFAVSAAINNFCNSGIGLLFKKNPNGATAYYVRSYVSTAIAQFADNLIFSFVVSHVFFGWNATQCVVCAATGMAAELLFQVVFSPLGFAICKKWESENVGKDYLTYNNGENL